MNPAPPVTRIFPFMLIFGISLKCRIVIVIDVLNDCS